MLIFLMHNWVIVHCQWFCPSIRTIWGVVLGNCLEKDRHFQKILVYHHFTLRGSWICEITRSQDHVIIMSSQDADLSEPLVVQTKAHNLRPNKMDSPVILWCCDPYCCAECDDWPVSVASEALDTASGDLSSVGLTGLTAPSPTSLSGGAGSMVAVAIGVRSELRMDGCSTTMPLCSWTGRQQQGLPCHCLKW